MNIRLLSNHPFQNLLLGKYHPIFIEGKFEVGDVFEFSEIKQTLFNQIYTGRKLQAKVTKVVEKQANIYLFELVKVL